MFSCAHDLLELFQEQMQQLQQVEISKLQHEQLQDWGFEVLKLPREEMFKLTAFIFHDLFLLKPFKIADKVRIVRAPHSLTPHP
jgi:hypothetical protein